MGDKTHNSGAKRKKYSCTFTKQLQDRFPGFKKGRHESEVECKVCPVGTYISISHKGALDLEYHLSTSKHKSNLQSVEGVKQIQTFFQSKDPKTEEKVHAAEGTLAFHTVSHHQSFKSMDCSSKLQKTLFPDSKIVKDVTCARTKAEAIITSVLSPHSIDISIEVLKGISCFGLATDGSNHGASKIFPILVQYFDFRREGVTTKIIELRTIVNETAQTISGYIVETLKNLKLDQKCVAFSGDNTNTNFGGVNRRQGNNVYTLLKRDLNSNLLGAGCPAHVLHNCVQSGLDKGLTIDVESIVLKIFNYFSIYTVRTEELKDFCDFVEIEYRQLLRHSKTRWLSLSPCVNRVLQMFPALKSYFQSQDSVPIIIKNFFYDEFSEIRLLFVQSLMLVFHDRIKYLEKEKNSMAETMSILQDVLNTLVDRKSNSFVPLSAKGMIKKLEKEGFSTKCTAVGLEFENVYEGSINYLKKWLIQYQEFKIFHWMKLDEIPSWEEVEDSILFVNDRAPFQINDSLCHDQFCNFVLFLKKHKEEEALHNSQSKSDNSKKKLYLSNDIWVKYFQSLPNHTCFSELLKLVEYFYCIPGHNAAVERVFSLMNAQWTKERNRLKVESVKSLLCVKYNLKSFSCEGFYRYLLSKKDLLNKIGSASKYSWHKGEGSSSSSTNVFCSTSDDESD